MRLADRGGCPLDARPGVVSEHPKYGSVAKTAIVFGAAAHGADRREVVRGDCGGPLVADHRVVVVPVVRSDGAARRLEPRRRRIELR